MSPQTIFRVASRRHPFAQISNALLRDTRLSFEARGVLAFILSYPDDWAFSLTWLMKTQPIGRDRSKRIINEIIQAGHCNRSRSRNPDGTHGSYEYEFFDNGADTAAETNQNGFPVTGLPSPENPRSIKKHQSNKHCYESRGGKGRDQGTDDATAERLQFSSAIITELMGLGLDVEALIERYCTRTKGRRIDDPNAYLLCMGRDELAKRHGVTVADLKAASSRDRRFRTAAMASAVGAFSAPSEVCVAHARRRGGTHVDAAIAAVGERKFESQEAVDREFKAQLERLRFKRPERAIPASGQGAT